MPEIAEVARVVHFLRKSLIGKTLAAVKAQDDTIIYGKVGTSSLEVQKVLTGKKVMDVGRQGKYFWFIMSSPPHPVFHLGMTGWFHVKGEQSGHYRRKTSDEEDEWPPKYWKLSLETDGNSPNYAVFTDARRLARIRLVNCTAEEIRNTTPLKENGPDPTLDQDILTQEWFEKKVLSKRVPIKALLLDQANISGIGNWVGDEVLYHAKIHPEQYSNTFTSVQLKQLHTSMLYVCQTAVDLLAESSKFPEEWLFKHRWGKGKKDARTALPNGEHIIFLTVGGRTSCVVPSIQKKTGPTADEKKPKKQISDGESDETNAATKIKGSKKKPSRAKGSTANSYETSDIEESEQSDEPRPASKAANRKRKAAPEAVDEDKDSGEMKAKLKTISKKRKTNLDSEVKVEDEDVKHKPRARNKKMTSIEGASETKMKEATSEPASSRTKKVAAIKDEPGTKALGLKNNETIDGRRRSGRVSKQ